MLQQIGDVRTYEGYNCGDVQLADLVDTLAEAATTHEPQLATGSIQFCVCSSYQMSW